MSKAAESDQTPPKQRNFSHLDAFKWKPGECPNPKGRPRGARSKLGEQFVAALQADFEAHGQEVIEKVRTERPQDYLKVLASILPKELNVNTNALGEMSDDELAGTLITLRDLAATLDLAIAGAGEAPPRGQKSAGSVPSVQ